jgi:hypothetical protein
MRPGSAAKVVESSYGANARRRPSLLREVALILGLFMVYRVARLAITGHDDIALSNAWWVWSVERAMRLPDEVLLQQWALQWPDLLKAANWYYVIVHFPITLGFLAWSWWRRPAAEYRWARRLITGLTALALVVHVLMPLAPPRMLSSLGFLDTMAVFGPTAYGGDAAKLANQFAAMPSLHVGWALLIALVVVRTLPGRARWLMVLHPTVTVVVVVATANHYWVDAIAAALVLAVALALVPTPYGPAPVARLWSWVQAISARSTSSPVGMVEPPDGSMVSPSASVGRMPSTNASSSPPRPRTPAD